MTLAEEIARKHLSSVAIRCTECVAALNELAERIFEQTRERAAQIGDVARPRVQLKPRARIVMAEEAYDAAMVDYSDLIRKMQFADIAGSEQKVTEPDLRGGSCCCQISGAVADNTRCPIHQGTSTFGPGLSAQGPIK